MATIVNELDVTLQTAISRDADPRAGKYMNLTADTSNFKVNYLGGSPSFITLTALPVNIPAGTVTWGTTAGTLTGSGNVRTLNYSDMPVDQITVSASITYLGEVYSSNIVITKLTEGGRGPSQFFAVGSIWSDSVADAATTGENLTGDVVTIFNNSTFAETRKWSGTAWVALGRVNSGADIATDTITASLLKNGILDATKFATSIEPVTMVSSVPGAKSTSTIFNTTDGKLYRWNGTAYVATVPTGDITGQIVATQIATDAVVAGKIAAAAISAREVQAGAITTDKLVVQSQGSVISDDPLLEDVANAWTFVGSGISVGSGTTEVGAACDRYFQNTSGGSNAIVRTTKAYGIDPLKTYSLFANLYANGANNRQMIVFVDFIDKNGAIILGTGWGDGFRSGFVYGGLPPGNVWTKSGGQFGAGTAKPIPATTRTCRVGVIFQYNGSGSTNVNQAVQDVRLEKVNDGTLIADGAITTQKIVAGAITASKLQIGGIGAALNSDPNFADYPAAWEDTSGTATKYVGPGGNAPANTYLGSTSYSITFCRELIPIDAGKTYTLGGHVYTDGGNDRLLIFIINFYDAGGTRIASTGWGDANFSGFSQVFVPTAGNWNPYRSGKFGANAGGRTIPSTARYCRIAAGMNIGGTATGLLMACTNMKLEEVIPGVLIQDGAITADKITVTSLSAIKATIGLLRTATSGARTEIADNVIKVYDASNVLRVKIGDLSL